MQEIKNMQKNKFNSNKYAGNKFFETNKKSRS